MKKNTLCRLTAFTTALAVICGGAVSCGSGGKTDKTKETSKSDTSANKTAVSNDAEQAKANIATSLKAVPTDLELNVESVSAVKRLENSDKIIVVASVKEKIAKNSAKKNNSETDEESDKTAESEKTEEAEKEEDSEKAEEAEKEEDSEKAEETEKKEDSDKTEDAEKEEDSDEDEKSEKTEDSDEDEDSEETEIRYKQKLFITDTSLTEMNEIEVEFDGEDQPETTYTIAPAGDGTISVLETVNDYGDLEYPDEYDEDFDYEALEEARTTTYKYYNIDIDGNIITKADVEDLAEYAGSDKFYADQLIPFGKDKYLLCLSDYSTGDAHAVAIDMSGEIVGEVDLDGLQWIMSAVEISDDKCLVCGYSTMGVKMKYFDTNELKPDGKEIELADSSVYNITSMIKGDDEYLMYANTMSGLYGIKEDGSCEEKINWADCDLDSTGLLEIIPIDNGEYAVLNYSYEDSEGFFYRLVERDANELENTKIVTIGTLYDDYQVKEMISKFNKEHDDIRLKAVNYEKYYDYDEDSEKVNNTPSRQLKMDIVAGKAPDMIVSYDRSIISSLAGKGVFADLYGLMDDELGKDDIIENILKANEYDGKLLSLSPTFYIESYACKTKYCDKENWTFKDLKETYESLPDGMELCELDSNEAVLQIVLPVLAECIDYSTNTCNFDTPELREMVEFCAQFPDTEEIIDWKNASDEEMNDFMNEMENKVMEDKSLLSSVYLSEFRDYKRIKEVTFNDDITFVGVPSEDGCGGLINFNQAFSILDSSDAKAECWEFVKEFFTEKAYEDSYYFPTKKSEFDKAVENAMKKRTYTDEDGVEHEIDDVEYINNKQIKLDPLNEEERDFIVNYVKSINKVAPDLSDEVMEMGEECLKYYFKGEKTLDETIELLQSKVSLYLSEQS